MGIIYKVQITYPNGRVEVIEEDFKTGKDALEYGNSMLAQIAQTEKFHGGFSDDKQEARFYIIEIKGKKQRVVYDSSSR